MDASRLAFGEIKTVLAQTTLLLRSVPSATLSTAADASDFAVGSVLQQQVSGMWQPLEFFSRRLTPTETKYSAFGRELLAAYSPIKHFRHAAEGRALNLFTDHKPLTYALHTKSDRYSPRDYISQFTNDLLHIRGESNYVAGVLSRIDINSLRPTVLHIPAMAAAQAQDTSCIKAAHSNSLKCQSVPLATEAGAIVARLERL